MADGKKGRGIHSERAIRRAIRALKRPGFEIDHTSGSHCVLRHRDGRRIVIPRHNIVKPGLLLDQLKKASIPWDDFEDAL